MADTRSRQGARYDSPEILRWVADVHAPHDAGLARAFASPETSGLPAIQLGPSEGKLVGMLVALARAKNVVEVGTLAGYSAIRIARALPPGGRLYTLEMDARHADVAEANLAAAGVADRVTVLRGPALASLEALEPLGPFDAVFLDADKGGYAAYGRWAARVLPRGGLLVADNVYLFGRLLDDGDEAASVRAFHEEAARAFDTACVPTPDGLLVGVKR